VSQKVFKDARSKIDTSVYPQKYDNSPLIELKSNECPKFNYAKNNDAELLYDKVSGNLTDITFCETDNLYKTCIAKKNSLVLYLATNKLEILT
jgi:hypothetical protein